MEVVSNATILKSSLSSIRNYIQSRYEIPHRPSEILDPLSTMIRLSLLAFYQEGTKITIGNNTILYQSPGVLQGATRWSWGSKRSELHLLFKPLIRALKRYSKKQNEIVKIFKFAVEGIKKLKMAYPRDNNVTIYSLNFYIHTIEKGHEDGELLDILEIEDDLNVFESLWPKKDILLISLLLDKLKENKRDKTASYHYLRSISHVLDAKDEVVRSIIKDTTAKI